MKYADGMERTMYYRNDYEHEDRLAEEYGSFVRTLNQQTDPDGVGTTEESEMIRSKHDQWDAYWFLDDTKW